MTSLEMRMERAPSLGEPCDPGLSFLLDIVRAEHSKDAALTDAIRDHLSALTAAWAQPSESPPDLVGRKSPCSPPEWHLQRFIELLDAPAPADRDVDRARRRYHARWLGRLLAPERAEFRPSVTILIPVYNRVSMAVEAVESSGLDLDHIALVQADRDLRARHLEQGLPFGADGVDAALFGQIDVVAGRVTRAFDIQKNGVAVF